MSAKVKFSIPLIVLFIMLVLVIFGLFIFPQSHTDGQIINDDQKYPLLKDNPTSKSYKLKLITSEYWRNITYSPSNNIFLVDAPIILKVNSNGVEIFSIKLDEWTKRLPFTHYLVDLKGIYDLSHQTPELEKFVQIVNGDKNRTLTIDSFTEIYSQAYKDADVVLYDRPNFEEGIDKFRAYMHIDGDWVLFYLSIDAINLDDDYDLGVTVENYPAKYDRMILLKDISSDVYSSSSYRLRDREITLVEDKLNYPVMGVLELMRFLQGEVSETFPYTSIPVVYRGLAYHRLTIFGEYVYFSEIALKQIFKEVESGMNWYVVPEPYQQKTSVGFLEYSPHSNIDTSGSDGIYVLIAKTTI